MAGADLQPECHDRARGGGNAVARVTASVQSSFTSFLQRRPGRKVRFRRGQRWIEHTHFSADWVVMAPAMLLAFALIAVRIGQLPDIDATAMALVAMMIGAMAPLFIHLEQEVLRGQATRLPNMLAGVGLPMLLFGMALGDWFRDSSAVTVSSVVVVLTLLSMLSATLLNGLIGSVVTAKVGLWLGAWLGSWPSPAHGPALVTILVAAFAGALLTLRQERRDAADREHQREHERLRRRAEKLLEEYEETGQGWFWETDRRGIITYVSPTIGDVLRKDVRDLVGRPFTELFILNVQDREGERTLNFHLSARSSFKDLAVHAATAGEERWWSISGRPIHDHFNNFLGFRGSGSDLTEKRRSQEHASRLAHYDSLTGLANRFQMSETLEKILNARREDHRVCSVFLLDLDRFKQVNDTMGHPAGDALLKQVAQRLLRAVEDAGRVGRLGGDEFKVIIPGHTPREDLAALADRIIESLSQPYTIDGLSVVIGVSVGIAMVPEDGVTSEALIRNADLALYAAKDGGRGRHHFYDPDLHSEAEERRQLEQDLRDALRSGGLELHYQPVVHTTTESITGFEALLRWNHPRQGYLSPAKFIPIAEDAGLIAPIGEWALRTACQDMARWPDTVRVAVNVSPLQFSNPALPSLVTSALAAAQVDPSRLELEITESVFLQDDRSTDAMFTALKGVGVRMALDDFGTGYSSLGYLKKAPFDKIKIDQSFVRGATVTGSRNGAIIASIVSLAEALGMETTAEGVETLDELDLVRLLGCSHIQGYIYEKPLTAEAATARLEAGLKAVASGPRSARATRQKMLRKVILEHNGQRYPGTVRNMSTSGAMIEGLWNVPAGTVFRMFVAVDHAITATARWCNEDRMGVEFAKPLQTDADGRISIRPGGRTRKASATVPAFRKAS